MSDETDDSQVKTSAATGEWYVDPNSGAAPQPGGQVYGGEPAPVPDPDEEEIDPTDVSFGHGRDAAAYKALELQAAGPLTPEGQVGPGAQDSQEDDAEDPNPDQGEDEPDEGDPSLGTGEDPVASHELETQASGDQAAEGAEQDQDGEDPTGDDEADEAPESGEETSLEEAKESTDAYDDKDVWPYKDLQEESGKRGLSGQGSRAELVQRLREDDLRTSDQ